MIESAFAFFVLGWLSGLFTTVVVLIMLVAWEVRRERTMEDLKGWGRHD